jgi:hypothetical protein
MLVTSRTTKTYQKANVTGNAIADRAEARQMDEETFFKKRRQRIVKVGGLGKSPEVLDDLGSFGPEAEEIWQHSESLADALFQLRRGTSGRFRIAGRHCEPQFEPTPNTWQLYDQATNTATSQACGTLTFSTTLSMLSRHRSRSIGSGPLNQRAIAANRLIADMGESAVVLQGINRGLEELL